MSFNEADVNRERDGKFGEKTGAPANVSLTHSDLFERYLESIPEDATFPDIDGNLEPRTLPSVAELDAEEYRLAGIRELEAWEQYVYSAHGETSRTILEAYPDAERLYVEEMVNEDDGTSYFSPERIEDATGKVLWEGERELREKLIGNTFWLSEDNFDYDNNEGPDAQPMLELHEHTMSKNTMTMDQYQEIRNERLAFDQKKLATAAREQFPTASRVYVEEQGNSLNARAIGDETDVFWTDVDGGNVELNRLATRFDTADPMVKTTDDGQQYIELPIDIMNPHTWSDTPF